jgi:hypothetical protein
VLSPNDVRTEEGWLRSTDPTAPPAMGGAKPNTEGDGEGDKPAAPPPADKVARLDQRRARHGDD